MLSHKKKNNKLIILNYWCLKMCTLRHPSFSGVNLVACNMLASIPDELQVILTETLHSLCQGELNRCP